MTTARAIGSAARRAANSRVLALSCFALIAGGFTSPLYRRPFHLGHGDWLWFHFTWDSARKSLLTFGEIPWWNPYTCGGTLGVANPQSFVLSPLYWLFLPLPTALAMKAYLTFMVFVGLWGTYELCRKFHGSGPFTWLAAVMFACSGTLGWHINGQISMAAFELLPWVVYGALRGRKDARYALLGGAALALMVLSGGVYPTLFACLTVAFLAVVHFSREMLSSAARVAGWFVTLAAVKLVPVAEFLRDHGRPIPRDDAIAPALLWRALFERRTTETQIWPHEGYAYAWWGEYGNYLGWAGVTAAAIAITVGLARARREVILLAIAFALMLGDHGNLAPYTWLRKLPLLGSFRVPTRFWTLFDLWLACLVARAGFLFLRGMTRRPNIAPLVGGVAVIASAWLVLDLVRTNGVDVLKGAMQTPPAPSDRGKGPVRMTNLPAWSMYRYPAENVGTLACWDEMSVEIAGGRRAGRAEEIYLLDAEAGTVVLETFSPSEVSFRVETTRDATVVMNQNAYRGWRVSGGELVGHEGLVAARVSAGAHRVRLFFRPIGYQAGIVITGTALLLGALLLARRGRLRFEPP